MQDSEDDVNSRSLSSQESDKDSKHPDHPQDSDISEEDEPKTDAVIKDIYGPFVPKVKMAKLMAGNKRIDTINDNFCINPAIFNIYKKDILKLPSLMGTKLNMAISGFSSTLLNMHCQMRVMAKFGLDEYQTFLTNSSVWDSWDEFETRDKDGDTLPEYRSLDKVDINLKEHDKKVVKT